MAAFLTNGIWEKVGFQAICPIHLWCAKIGGNLRPNLIVYWLKTNQSSRLFLIVIRLKNVIPIDRICDWISLLSLFRMLHIIIAVGWCNLLQHFKQRPESLHQTQERIITWEGQSESDPWIFPWKYKHDLSEGCVLCLLMCVFKCCLQVIIIFHQMIHLKPKVYLCKLHKKYIVWLIVFVWVHMYSLLDGLLDKVWCISACVNLGYYLLFKATFVTCRCVMQRKFKDPVAQTTTPCFSAPIPLL